MSAAKNQSSKRDSTKTPPDHRRWSHALFFLLGILVAAGVHGAFSHNAFGWFDTRTVPARPGSGQSGPWGELVYTPLKLERPQESLDRPVPDPKPMLWRFYNFTQAQLEEFLQKTELTLPQRQLLVETNRWRALTNGWAISPPLEVVRDMSPAARKSIYAALRNDPLNHYIQTPLRMPAEKLESWLDDCQLPEARKALLRSLVVMEGNLACFYDGLLMEWLCSPEEKKHLARAISQCEGLLVKLQITPRADMEALARYWAPGSRRHSMKPFLESLGRVPEGVKVSVSFFFPTFARMRLYTYPDARNPLAERKDCFYTAMNFFNETPDARFFNPAAIQAALRSEYTPVKTNWSFGDVLMLKDNASMAIHMCVYIADDVVFTKNGASLVAPWTLMKLPEMLKVYQPEQPIVLVGYRKKAI